MTSAARKVTIAIIVILICSIGYILYYGHRSETPNVASNLADFATSSPKTYGPYEYNQDYIKELVNQKFSQSENVKVLDPATYQPLYKLKDLRVSNDTNETAMRAYGLEVLNALKPLAQERKNESELVVKALNDKDESAVQNIIESHNTDLEMLDQLLRIRVPKTATTVHLNIVNALYADSVLLNNMSGVLDDPYFALTSTSAYQTTHVSFFRSLEGLNQFFISNGIKFESDGGTKIYVNL